jgi:tRNA threonylcarbamoyl adenosine modification protein YjeE
VSSYYPTSAEEMMTCGEAIARTLHSPTVVALYGDLGAGKTTLAKGIISGLTGASPDEISSPTFQYVAFYEGHNVLVAHYDLWRLPDADSFFQMGLDEHLSRGICLIEWPERIHQMLSPSTMRISIDITAQGRVINIRNS